MAERKKPDAEAKAISRIIAILDELGEEARSRVWTYLERREDDRIKARNETNQ